MIRVRRSLARVVLTRKIIQTETLPKVDVCGIHFAVVASGPVGIGGSINFMNFDQKGLGVTFKMSAFKIEGGIQRTLTIKHAWLRTANGGNILSFVAVEVEDPQEFMAISAADDNAIKVAGGLVDGGWIGFKVPDKTFDQTVPLPPIADAYVLETFQGCLNRALRRLKWN